MIDVDKLPPRVAHAVHALMYASLPGGGGGFGPFTAAEVCVYDANWEAFSPSHTGAALREAQKRGLVIFVPGGYWTPTNLALDHRRAFERRFLADDPDGER